MLLIHIVMTLQSRVSPFGNLRIKVCSQLPEAYRNVLRPSSPLNAKASTKRPFHTLLNSQTFFIQKRVKIKFVIKYKYHLILISYLHFKNLLIGWWRRTGSNRRPIACKATALPTELRPLYWWAREDLNLRPHAYQACALTN